MPQVHVEEQGCRGCTMCADICPVDVFDFDEGGMKAASPRADDCIGCLSCFYLCPSQCITVSDIKMTHPFHRIAQDVQLVNRFLQSKTPDQAIPGESLDAAMGETGLLLTALSEAINEILGRGHRSVGRRAGTVAASHMPELYEEAGVDDLLRSMKKRFGGSFNFDYRLDGGVVYLDAAPCGLLSALEKAGKAPGKAELCILFHEYWAGLLSAFTGAKYMCTIEESGTRCVLKLEPQKI
jgi:NAD-dependent dihydropyrimidine dehydrogenase PreA subunit